MKKKAVIYPSSHIPLHTDFKSASVSSQEIWVSFTNVSALHILYCMYEEGSYEECHLLSSVHDTSLHVHLKSVPVSSQEIEFLLCTPSLRMAHLCSLIWKARMSVARSLSFLHSCTVFTHSIQHKMSPDECYRPVPIYCLCAFYTAKKEYRRVIPSSPFQTSPHTVYRSELWILLLPPPTR